MKSAPPKMQNYRQSEPDGQWVIQLEFPESEVARVNSAGPL